MVFSKPNRQTSQKNSHVISHDVPDALRAEVLNSLSLSLSHFVTPQQRAPTDSSLEEEDERERETDAFSSVEVLIVDFFPFSVFRF